ncbi:MAG: PorT family protein [Phaeodactylibacter sp.]|nr:PorT family protein [Phaeodactylibacter sp.]
MKPILTFFLLLLISPVGAQRFGAGAILGLNASQIDGDNQFGYRQFGPAVGLRGIAHLSDRVDLQVELLYSRRGSAARNQDSENPANPVDINLQYAETPILLGFKAIENWDGEYVLHFCSGFSYSRLLRSKVVAKRPNPAGPDDFSIPEIEKDFRRNELGWVVGTAYLPIPQLSIGLRHVLALTPLYKGDVPGGKTLRSYYFQMQVAYQF